MSRKGTLKKIVRDVLKAFGHISAKQSEHDQFYFLAKSFFSIIENHFLNPHVSPSLETIHASRTIDSILFTIEFKPTESHTNATATPNCTTDMDTYDQVLRIVMSRHNLLTCCNMIKALENYTIHNYIDGFFVHHVNSFQKTILLEGKQSGVQLSEPATESYYIKYPLDTFSADAELFYRDFFLSDIVTSDDDVCTIDNFFLCTWRRPSEFVRSAIVNFSIYNDGLSDINFCDNCNKMFIPERSSENRGRFCTPKCQKSSHYNSNEILNRCQSRQRNTINAMANTLSNVTKRYIEPPRAPSLAQCRNCKAIIDAEKVGIHISVEECPELRLSPRCEKFILEYNEELKKRKEQNTS